MKLFLPSASGDRQSQEVNDSQLLSWAEGPEDLGCPPKLDPHVQMFLSRVGVPYIDNDNSNQSSTLEPPFDDNYKWIMWCACQVETPVWWPKLQNAPQQKDTIQFTRGVWAWWKMITQCLLHPTA